jgi:hypothetical protein
MTTQYNVLGFNPLRSRNRVDFDPRLLDLSAGGGREGGEEAAAIAAMAVSAAGFGPGSACSPEESGAPGAPPE